jgi:ABC-type antimicrobial peptide transport system permease subunit
VLGVAVSFAASFLIAQAFELQFEFSRNWILTAVAIAVGGSLFGALYPAWKASTIDPVEVMVNE